jgi:glycosyltransferase involved in cell wall biosynthesis
MKVLWFTNTFIPVKDQSKKDSLRHSGGWMLALCQAIGELYPGNSLAIASTGPVNALEHYNSGGKDCFVVPMQNKNSMRQQKKALKVCTQIVEEWEPDVIHIHGTERFFGLLSARNLISVPTVISIQGLVIPYAEWYHFFGNRSFLDIVRLHRFIELPLKRGLFWDYKRFKKLARNEHEILVGNRHFMGRTDWDRTHLLSINKDAVYYHVGEMLREPFWQTRWNNENFQRHYLFFINPGHPRKGVETLFEAADILKSEYPGLVVAVAGAISNRSGYGLFIKKEMQKRQDYVVHLGSLNAKEIASELSRSHVFVSPSYIENSSNAVCEAQLVGAPVVASYTGGLTSLIEDGQTGLFFPPGDAPILALMIKRIFESDNLAQALSINAREVALKRHDGKAITRDLVNTYETVVNGRL